MKYPVVRKNKQNLVLYFSAPVLRRIKTFQVNPRVIVTFVLMKINN
jgi:hypothetical protein